MACDHVRGGLAINGQLADGLARKVVSKYELYHKGMQGKAAGLKA